VSAEITVFDDEQEFYALFVRILGPRGGLLLFYDEEAGPPMDLVAELARVLESERVDGRDAMVTVYDSLGRYVGCMGANLWEALLDARYADGA
jgi:hypothetical protein